MSDLVAAERIRDICNIFKEITGLPADPSREAGVITYWIQHHGWSLYEFRKIIEFQFSDPYQKEFYAKPGNLNLRLMLKPAAADRITDILNSLKYTEQMREKQELLKGSDPGVKIVQMKTICGEEISILYRKGLPPDRSAYEEHQTECFERRGGCFFPCQLNTSVVKRSS